MSSNPDYEEHFYAICMYDRESALMEAIRFAKGFTQAINIARASIEDYCYCTGLEDLWEAALCCEGKCMNEDIQLPHWYEDKTQQCGYINAAGNVMEWHVFDCSDAFNHYKKENNIKD